MEPSEARAFLLGMVKRTTYQDEAEAIQTVLAELDRLTRKETFNIKVAKNALKEVELVRSALEQAERERDEGVQELAKLNLCPEIQLCEESEGSCFDCWRAELRRRAGGGGGGGR